VDQAAAAARCQIARSAQHRLRHPAAPVLRRDGNRIDARDRAAATKGQGEIARRLAADARQQEKRLSRDQHAAQIAAVKPVGGEAVNLDCVDQIEIAAPGQTHLDHRLRVAAIKAPAQIGIEGLGQIGGGHG
jgi:hypothetical protein